MVIVTLLSWLGSLFLGGMVYEGGKDAGYDLSKHVAHLPGIEMNVPETMEKMISGDWKGVKEELGAARLKLPPRSTDRQDCK